MKTIAVLGHWHTGTSLTMKALHYCGVQLGNEKTSWVDNVQYEHGFLNRIGDELVLGKINPDKASKLITEVLKQYVIEAYNNKWSFYGIKTTHALHSQSFPIFKSCFDKIWPDVSYVLCVRNILGIMASTANDKKWTREQIEDSWLDTLQNFWYIYQYESPVIFIYPDDWINGKIPEKVEKLGLEWNSDVMELFDEHRQKSFSEYDLNSYYDWREDHLW